MDQVTITEILNSIKTDNLVHFSTLIKGKENLSFGRFPLLTLCYLYNAKKIIKEHFNKLCKIKEYVYITELFEIYKYFKKFAGRALRVYSSSKDIISYIEILAILHKDKLVLKNFKHFSKDQGVVSKLKKIYLINGQSTYTSISGLKISKPKLTNSDRKKIKNSIIFSSVSILVFAIIYIVMGLTVGLGTNIMPIKISNEKQLIMALNSSGSYVLTKDLELDSSTQIDEFEGKLNGGNHTISISEVSKINLIEKNNGTIKNLNISYSEIKKEISTSLSLFVGNNNGTIDNVNIKCEQLDLECSKSNSGDINFSGIATINNGSVKDCSVYIKSNIVAVGEGECVFAGMVGNNYGTISDCEILDGSSVLASEVDVAGIVGYNDKDASINNCKNYAKLTQYSNLPGWSPNASGISLTNYGLISDSKNYADLSVISEYDLEEDKGDVLVAGISTWNFGTISKCLNVGNLSASANTLIIYIGGITAYSYYNDDMNVRYIPRIDNCISECDITASTIADKGFVFAGGISGVLYGEITNSFAINNFSDCYDGEKYFVGSCLGASFIVYQLSPVVCVSASGNYVLDNNMVEYQIASLIFNGNISTGLDSNDIGQITTALSEDTLKSQEYYWYE